MDPRRPRTLVIGEAAGIGPAIQFVEQARAQRAVPPWRPLVLLGSAGPFPFRPRPSVILVPGMPPGVIACMPLLEEWGIASRLASTLDLPGCFEGAVRTLADVWLASLNGEELAQVEVFGNDELARRYGVPSL
jgi:dihydroorotate dehydrogenase electron transfer subunit